MTAVLRCAGQHSRGRQAEAVVVVPMLDEERSIAACVTAIAAAMRSVRPRTALVLVDNLSSDGTVDVAVRIARQSDVPVCVVSEPRRGPGHARAAGVRHHLEGSGGPAPGEDRRLLLHTDADCLVPADWVDAALRAASSQDAQIWSGPLIHSATELAGYPTTRRVLGRRARLKRRCEELFGMANTEGNNLWIRASAYRAVGGFQQPVGSRGQVFPAEDWRLGHRCRVAGLLVTGHDRAVVSSARRVTADPFGYLTNAAYEREFRRVDAGDRPDLSPRQESAVTATAARKIIANYAVLPLLLDPDRLNDPAVCETLSARSVVFLRNWVEAWSAKLDPAELPPSGGFDIPSEILEAVLADIDLDDDPKGR